MEIITSTESLAAFCHSVANKPYITVDTEFLRDKTYWPILCLIQVATPEDAVIIDPLADGIDLAPLFDLMSDQGVLKVFHAARQDIEIFHLLSGNVPAPLFDTQIAAMITGHGDQVGYETLVRKMVGASVDKSFRFTDWSRRPLTDKQLQYALSDVTHLCVIHEQMQALIAKGGRQEWIAEEMAILSNPETYIQRPEDAWRRLKIRTNSSRVAAIVRELAAYREREAQSRDVPRGRILKDDTLIEVATQKASTTDALSNLRTFPKGQAGGRIGKDIAAAVERAMKLPKENLPELPGKPAPLAPAGPVGELLKVFLKIRAKELGVATRLIASANEIERFAAERGRSGKLMQGWRGEVFGQDALKLLNGEIALAAKGPAIVALPTGTG